MPRIQGASIAEHHQLVRGRILDGFGAEMSGTGFAGLTLARVANRAGIARATVYNYFPDKNDLLLAYVQRNVDEFIARVEQEITAIPNAGDRLARLVRTQIESFAIEPGTGSTAGMLDGGTLSPEVFDALMGRLAGLHGMVRKVLVYGIQSGEFRAADDLQAVVEMIGAVIGSQRMPVGEGRRSIDEAVDLVLPFVLAAIRA